MLKKISELTENDKHKFIEASKQSFEKTYKLPWSYIEYKTQEFIDNAFDDTKYPKMSPDDQIDAAYARKAFGKTRGFSLLVFVFLI